MTLPGNANFIRVRGFWFDQLGGGVAKTITFTPTATDLTDMAAFAYIQTDVVTVTPDPTTASFYADLIATNDPDLTPFAWTVVRQGQAPVTFTVDYAAPTVDIGGGVMKQAVWLVDAATTTAPSPVNTYYTSAQTDAAIATALAGASAAITPTAVKTSAYTAVVGDLVPVNTTSGTVTITLPTTPVDKAQIAIKHVIQGGTNAVTIACGGSDVINKTGGSTSFTLSTLNQGVWFEYKASTGIWYAITSDLSLAQLDARYTAAATALPLAGGTVTGDLAVSGHLTQSGFQLPLLGQTRRVPYRAPVFTQNFQTGHGWSATGAGVSTSNLNDTSIFVRGTQSATVTTAANGSQSAITLTGGTARDLTGKMIRLTFYIADVTHLANIVFYAGTSGLANYFYFPVHTHSGSALNYVQSGEWVTCTVSWADIQSAGGTFSIGATGVPSVTTGMTDMRFAVTDDAAGAVTYHLQSVEIVPDTSATFPNGVVSLTFDDSYQSVYDLARPYMDGYGYRGTLYTIVQNLGTSTYLTLPELQSVAKYSGWEVAGHAYTSAAHNAGYQTLTSDQVNVEMRSMKAWLVSNGFPADNFAYPSGRYDKTTDGVPIDQIAGQYFSTARTIVSENGEVWPPAMPQRMKAKTGISSFAGGTVVSTITATGGPLDRCVNDGDWYIIALHQILASSLTANTQILQSDFNTLMDAINSRGIPVLPVGDVVRYYS